MISVQVLFYNILKHCRYYIIICKEKKRKQIEKEKQTRALFSEPCLPWQVCSWLVVQAVGSDLADGWDVLQAKRSQELA